MRVNDAKTNVMCISGARSYEAKMKIVVGDEQIKGADKMNILGVTLDKNCGFASHVLNAARKLRSRSWAISRLKRKGMSEGDLLKVYSSLIRPVVEYASPVWHSTITSEQSYMLEKEQSHVLRQIYGPGVSAKGMRIKANLPLLSARRKSACIKFARKNVENKGVKSGLLNARNRNIQEDLERGDEYIRNEWRERTD